MPRFKLTIEYDGKPYAGWQRQAGRPTVQAALEAAAAGFCGETTAMRGAGRTDAGVHALGQVAHADFSREWPARTLVDAFNFHLGKAGERIAVLAAEAVDAGFDARFSATCRHYRYSIVNRRTPPALMRGRALWVSRPLDAAAMDAAARRLVGRHDFTTFRSAHCQASSPVRTLRRLEVRRKGERIEILASARSFLHTQVRSLAGTLIRAGEGAWSIGDVSAALAACDRRACGPVAGPEGLYFVEVEYGASRDRKNVQAGSDRPAGKDS